MLLLALGGIEDKCGPADYCCTYLRTSTFKFTSTSLSCRRIAGKYKSACVQVQYSVYPLEISSDLHKERVILITNKLSL